MNAPNVTKPGLPDLPRADGRISFLYLDKCLINREDGSISATNRRGTVHLPAAQIGTLLLGPGTTVTHRAMELLGDSGASVCWVGDRGIRFYAGGTPMTHSSALLMAQAKLSSNLHSRLSVARKMYGLRFPGEDFRNLRMQQLRGKEGTRVRSTYRMWSEKTGVEWNGRIYKPGDWDASDPVNMSLTAANSCLYAIAYSVIVALGCSPGLGFIHVGHERSFVFDIADIYKAETTIPVAFNIASESDSNVGSRTRRAFREAITGTNLMGRMVRDIVYLLSGTEEDTESDAGDLYLWDEEEGIVPSGVSYRS